MKLTIKEVENIVKESSKEEYKDLPTANLTTILAAQILKDQEALKAITQVSQFGRDNGPIVQSEHYEEAWLDCVDIAKAALLPKE